jgi:hypothetical protein
MIYHIFELNDEGEDTEYMDSAEDDMDPTSHHWILPSVTFEGLWDSLIFEDDLRSQVIKQFGFFSSHL